MLAFCDNSGVYGGDQEYQEQNYRYLPDVDAQDAADIADDLLDWLDEVDEDNFSAEDDQKLKQMIAALKAADPTYGTTDVEASWQAFKQKNQVLFEYMENAAQNPAPVKESEYLEWYRAYLTARTEGVISVTVNIEACGDMKQVGASKIALYEAADGISFSSVKTYKYDEYPAMMGSGWDHVATVVTYNGTPGYA